MHTQNRTEGKKKKKSQAPATCSWISFSLCSRSFVLLQAARAAVEPEWECASIAKAQDTALFLPSHGEGGGQGSVAGEHFGKIFQNDKSPLPQPLHAQESCPPSHLHALGCKQKAGNRLNVHRQEAQLKKWWFIHTMEYYRTIYIKK